MTNFLATPFYALLYFIFAALMLLLSGIFVVKLTDGSSGSNRTRGLSYDGTVRGFRFDGKSPAQNDFAVDLSDFCDCTDLYYYDDADYLARFVV